MATVILEADYARVSGNLKRIIPELPARFRVLQTHGDMGWVDVSAPLWQLDARCLAEHMLCFGYTAYQLEVPSENGARHVDVHRDELLRELPAPATELAAAIAENRAYAGRC